MKKSEIKLVILDVGGVLKDSRKAINHGFRLGFEKQGLDYPFHEDDVWHLRGIGKYNRSRKAISALYVLRKSDKELGKIVNKDDAERILGRMIHPLSEKELKTIEEIRKEYKRFFRSEEAKKMIKLYPKVKDSLANMNKKYMLAILTNSHTSTAKRDIGELAGYFRIIMGEENLKEKKPSPEGILEICRKLKTNPREAAYVGDSAADIQTAKRAGCVSIALTSGMGLEKHLRKEKPDLIFKDLYNLSKHL
jgi:HAD superfamily hydrolase (TIGR01662 family)